MTDFLKEMAALSTERAERAKAAGPAIGDIDKPVVPLKLGAFDVIAELKDRSPAEGQLAAVRTTAGVEAGSTVDSERAERARAYARGGAAAISVLTEPSRFAGDLGHLADVVAAVPDIPVMRKDFLVDPIQIREARIAGASGVLLIATMLSDERLLSMLDCACDYDMFVLLESFDENDLERSARLMDNAVYRDLADSGKLLFGVNTRNLRTLEVDGDRLRTLAPHLPTGRSVAESGLHEAADAASVSAWGYRLALVGTALMRSDDPAALIAAMREAGSAEAAS